MLILSQDKKAIHNFNNIISIQIEGDYTGFKLKVYDAINDYTSLGKYNTEERAKEVLIDILSRYEAIELCKYKPSDELGYTLGDYTPIYGMPEE